jgi:hypothetical protein
MFRLLVRHLNIISSSRIEGEFGGVNFLRLHANVTLRHAFDKLKWAAERRQRKKISDVETSFSKFIKRKSTAIAEADWDFVTKSLTIRSRKVIEAACADFKKYTNQLVEESMSELVFAVWRVEYNDTDTDDAVTEDDSSSDSDDGDVIDIELGPNAISEAGANAISGKEAEGGSEGRKLWEKMEPFRWRRVRRVKLVLVPDEKKYVVQCSCHSSEATCLPCVHQMNVIEDPFHALQLRNLDWHPRVTNAYYYSAVVTGSARDVHLAASSRVYPHITQVIVDEWRCVKQINASNDGVPEEGQLHKNFENVLYNAGNDDDHNDNDQGPENPRKEKRAPAYNGIFADRMHQAIHGALPQNSPKWKEYCMFQKQFLAEANRMRHAVRGVGASLRKKGNT